MIRNPFLSLLVAVCAVSALAITQDTHLLRRTLTESATDVYKVEIKSDNHMESPMGPMDMGVVGSMRQTFKLGKVDQQKGTAELEMTTSEIKMEMTGPMAEMAQGAAGQTPKDLVVKGVLDTRNRLQATGGPGMSPQLMMMMGPGASATGAGIEFPEGPVKIGDSWDVVVPKNPFLGDGEHKLRATLIGSKDVEGTSAWEIGLTGTIPFDVDMQELIKKLPAESVPNAEMMSGMKVLLKGQVEVSSTGLVEKSSGRLIKMESNLKTKQNVSLPDMGMSMDGTGTMRMAMTLQPPN